MPSSNKACIVASFLKLIEIDAEEARTCPDAFERLRNGDLQAIFVHGVYAPAVMSSVVERLERHDPPFLQTWFPSKFRSWFFGRNLNLADPGLEGYFAEAALFHQHLEALFPPGLGLAARVAGILSDLDGGRAFMAPPGRETGQHYMFTTLRAHLEGGYIPVHFDNEQALVPSFAHLRGLVELHMTSFVLTLQAAEGGGALEVYDHCCEPSDAYFIRGIPSAKPEVEGLASVSFQIPAGAMIVLDSGRYLHRVAPVQGSRKRWTACSFMALSRERNAMYCWG